LGWAQAKKGAGHSTDFYVLQLGNRTKGEGGGKPVSGHLSCWLAEIISEKGRYRGFSMKADKEVSEVGHARRAWTEVGGKRLAR